MALIKCPECGKEISEKAPACPNCGCPSSEWTKENKEPKMVEREICPFCGKVVSNPHHYCYNCGKNLSNIQTEKRLVPEEEKKAASTPSPTPAQQVKPTHQFNGVYRYSLLHGQQEVYCPRCGSEECSIETEEKIIPGKTKTTYTANLNPLKPFTLVNKKEKVVRKERSVTNKYFKCHKCGHTFL